MTGVGAGRDGMTGGGAVSISLVGPFEKWNDLTWVVYV